jgi:hypothetical protein
MLKRLNPLKRKKGVDISDFYVIDTETWGLSPKPENLAFGIIYQPGWYRRFNNVTELETILKKRRFRNRKIFGHNIEYDLTAIWGNIFQNLDAEAVFNNKFIYCKWGKSTHFFDSMNLFPMSLEKIGKQLGYPKGETPEKFFETSNKGKFEITEQDVNYCLTDCEITYKALFNFFQVTGNIKMTIGSMAMTFFRERFLKKPIFYNEHNEQFFNSYYGGRTEAFYLGDCSANAIDINSLYPFVMKTIKFPNPTKLKKGKKHDLQYFMRILGYYEGCARLNVIHRKTDYGFLPYKHNHRLCFPVGKLSGWWNFNEIRFALEHEAIDIIDIKEFYYAPSEKSIFAEFIDYVYGKRIEQNGGFMELIYKLLMNNLYGKFAQRRKTKRTYYETPPFEYIKGLNERDEWFNIQTLGEGREDIFLIEKNLKMEKSHTAVPSYASYITSAARIMLLKIILENSQKIRILYSDTDSIFYEGDLDNTTVDLGKELGQWKIEDKKIIQIRGLKNYRVVEGGKTFDKIKGIPKSAKLINGRYVYKTYMKTFSGIRGIKGRETGDSFEMSKKLSGRYNKRKVFKDGSTEPIIIN